RHRRCQTLLRRFQDGMAWRLWLRPRQETIHGRLVRQLVQHYQKRLWRGRQNRPHPLLPRRARRQGEIPLADLQRRYENHDHRDVRRGEGRKRNAVHEGARREAEVTPPIAAVTPSLAVAAGWHRYAERRATGDGGLDNRAVR